jgi:hypothetical protein
MTAYLVPAIRSVLSLMRNFAIALTTSESDQSLRQRSGNPYLIALRQSSPSFGSKVPTSSEQSNRTQRVNPLQTARREELRVDSVNLAEGGGMAVMARASERITPPNRSVSAK